MKQVLTSTLLLAALAPCAFADETGTPETSAHHVSGLIGGAFTFGGDKLAEYRVEYYGGDDGNEDIKAGEQFYLYGGAYYRYTSAPNLAYGAQVNFGWFNNSISGDDGDVSLTRYPLELIPYVEFHKFRLGLGLTRHMNIKFEDDAVLDFSVDAKDANGTVILLEYLFAEHLALGLRIVDIDYEFEEAGYTATFDAGHTGIGAAYLF